MGGEGAWSGKLQDSDGRHSSRAPPSLVFFLPHIFTVGVKWTVANSFDTTVRPSFRPANERTQGGKARTEGAPAAAADTADKWNGIEAPLAVREGGRNWRGEKVDSF